MDTLLEVCDLKVGFIDKKVLHSVVHGISFKIPKGDIVGIVGESGSGKSVSALSLMRLLPGPSQCRISGDIFLSENGDKVNLSTLPEHRMRQYRGNRMSMVFQEPMTSLNPVFTCGDQIVEALRAHQSISIHEASVRTIALFEKVKLQQPQRIFNSYPHQLSGGQKQRVMIALAVCCKPDLIIADEPTTALDVTVQKTILDLLKELQQQLQTSVLFITHDLGVIKDIANHVLVMYRGKIVERGEVQTIFSAPQHPYTKGLLACRPPIDRVLKKLPMMSDFIRLEGEKIIFKQTDIAALLQSLEPDSEDDAPQFPDTPILSVKNLTVQYPGKKNFWGKVVNWTSAVNTVSFDVKRGEVLGLAGESGCGKSTLGRAILQLVQSQSGAVWYHGIDLCRLSKKEMRKWRPKLQLIFQDPYSSLNPRLTIEQSLLEPMQLHDLYKNDPERKQKIGELLKKVGLPPQIINGYPHEFSGGQRQRICIARALALQPEFIICDESVSALDVSVQAQVLNLLLELKEEFGFSCIFISHDLSVLKFMCDRIMIMNRGRIEEVGSPEKIFYHPETDHTRKLLAAIPH